MYGSDFSLTVLVQNLLLLKTMTDEVKTKTDVFCNVDGMACCHGDPGLKMGTAVIHAYPKRRELCSVRTHLTPQCHRPADANYFLICLSLNGHKIFCCSFLNTTTSL